MPARESVLHGLLALMAPITCLGCKRPLPDADPRLDAPLWPRALCEGCREELAWIEAACLGCGQGRGPGLASCRRCPSCTGKARGRIAGTVALWRYRGPGRNLVRRLKYSDLPSLGPPLGAELAARVQAALGSVDPRTRVVPIPLHPIRRLTRGYNQAREVALGLAEALGLELIQPLYRWRYTRPLHGLAHQERASVVQRAFYVPRPATVAGRPVLLIDDVRTSGATLRTAARALHRAGATRIHAAVLAR